MKNHQYSKIFIHTHKIYFLLQILFDIHILNAILYQIDIHQNFHK